MLKSYIQLFKNKDYATLWIGQTGSIVGDALYQVAFYWLAYKLTSSPAMAGLVIFASSIPYLFFGLLGGVYADRLDRKKVLIVSDVIRAVTVAIVPVLAMLDQLPIFVLALTAFVLTSVRCFFYPAIKSATADILDDAQRGAGVAFMQASFQAAKVLGMAAGGLLINHFSAQNVYFLPVITYAISILFLLPLKSISKPTAAATRPKVFAEVIDTIRFIYPNRALFWSIALFGFGLLCIVGIDRVALPVLSDRIWNVGADGLGIIMAAFAIGNVVASLFLGHVKIKAFAKMIFTGWALWGIFYALVGASPTFWLAIAFATLAGASEALSDVPLVLLIQTSVPRDRMGKVFSMWSTFAFIGEAGSALLAGIVVTAFGPVYAYFAAGAGLVIVALIGLYLTRSPSPEMIAEPANEKSPI